ncbi:MAG: DUF3040 domain-containing protein [Candidatus Nanopelagicaceae bacterium]
MGLTDRERQIIEEMEAALQAEDPRLVATMARRRPSIALNIALILLGITLLLSGVIAKLTWLGILGFIVALAGAATIRIRPKAKLGLAKRQGPGRLQERWDRRNQD